jgi:hypothetical protein
MKVIDKLNDKPNSATIGNYYLRYAWGDWLLSDRSDLENPRDPIKLPPPNTIYIANQLEKCLMLKLKDTSIFILGTDIYSCVNDWSSANVIFIYGMFLYYIPYINLKYKFDGYQYTEITISNNIVNTKVLSKRYVENLPIIEVNYDINKFRFKYDYVC